MPPLPVFTPFLLVWNQGERNPKSPLPRSGGTYSSSNTVTVMTNQSRE